MYSRRVAFETSPLISAFGIVSEIFHYDHKITDSIIHHSSVPLAIKEGGLMSITNFEGSMS